MRRHGRDPETGADLEASPIRQRRRAPRIERDKFRGRAESTAVLRLVDPHPFTDPRRRYALADRLDDAGAVAAGITRP